MSATFFQIVGCVSVFVFIGSFFYVIFSEKRAYTTEGAVLMVVALIVMISSSVVYNNKIDDANARQQKQTNARITTVCGPMIPHQFKGNDKSQVYFTCGYSDKLHHVAK